MRAGLGAASRDGRIPLLEVEVLVDEDARDPVSGTPAKPVWSGGHRAAAAVQYEVVAAGVS